MTVTLTSNTTKSLGRPNGRYAISIRGDFGSGTLSIQHSSTENGTYEEFTDANGYHTTGKDFVFEWHGYVQVVLSGATNPNITITITKIG